MVNNSAINESTAGPGVYPDDPSHFNASGPVGCSGLPGPVGDPGFNPVDDFIPPGKSFAPEQVSLFTEAEDLGPVEGTALPDMLISLSLAVSKLLEVSADEGRPVRHLMLETRRSDTDPALSHLYAHLIR